jgi:hypothetical protein
MVVEVKNSKGTVLMARVSSSDALNFVRTVELPPPPKGEALGAGAEFVPNETQDQAVIVGSDIISFVKGVTDSRRQDLINSALLAQLVANKQVPDPTHVFTWYGAYFDALTNIGWTIQDRQFVDHVESSSDLEAHRAILSLATGLLGPSAPALKVITSTLQALQQMGEDSPWITIFNRESQFLKTVRFQVTLAEDAPGGQFLVTLMAFGVVAESRLTQVLFLKFRANDVRLKHSSGKVTINTVVLDSIREEMSNRLAGFAADYIRGLPDLQPS